MKLLEYIVKFLAIKKKFLMSNINYNHIGGIYFWLKVAELHITGKELVIWS